MPMGGAELQTLMPMTPNQRRSIAYPAALAVVAGLGWAATYRTEADFLTLLSSASIHAELAASIPADADSADGRALRSKLLGDAHDFLERAERVEPGTSGGRQIRAFLAMIEGDAARAAELYAEARSLPDCTPDQLGRLVMHEAKALSNAGRVEVALQLLDAHGAQRRPEDAVPWSALRARLLFRAGSVEDARAEARSLAAFADPAGEACSTAAALLEGMGDFGAAEAAYRKSGLGNEMQDYVIARLKLRAGETDRATSLLGQSVETGDPAVLRQMRRDQELWVGAIGNEDFDRLTAPSGQPAAPTTVGR
jgi:Flp pilus assembly protein TadD